MGGGIECRFDTICCNEPKWYPTIIIVRIILYGNKGSDIPLDLVIDLRNHVIHITNRVIMIWMYLGRINLT